MSALAQLCPKCGGQGHVAKPPWIAGDVHEWLASSTGGYTCLVCHRAGIITRPLKASS